MELSIDALCAMQRADVLDAPKAHFLIHFAKRMHHALPIAEQPPPPQPETTADKIHMLGFGWGGGGRHPRNCCKITPDNPPPPPAKTTKKSQSCFLVGRFLVEVGGACSQQTGIALQSCCESGSPPFASMGVEVPIGPQAIAIGARIQARSDMLESNNSILFLPILARSVCFSGPQARRALPARCGPIGSESVFWVQEKNSEPGFAIDERNDLVVEESCGQAPGPECPESSRLPQWGSVAGQSLAWVGPRCVLYCGIGPGQSQVRRRPARMDQFGFRRLTPALG